jgi:hypothetical protein
MLVNPPKSNEFIINKYITLRLEGGRTVIYVNNRPFRQCMYLLINIPTDRIRDYDQIRSIDEAATYLNRKMERNHNLIPPETEFWGHCSNLQAWADNDYDTRILHRNLAFPLLKALSDAGDPLAKQKFKEEIALRYATGHPTVVRFLTQNGYLHYLSEEEFESMLIDLDFPSIDEYSRKITHYLNDNNNPDSIKQTKLSTAKYLQDFRFSYKYLLLIKAMERIPNDLKQKYVEIIYDKYKNNRNFPLLKFLDKAQINYENLAIKSVYFQNKVIGLLLGNKLNLRNCEIDDITKIRNLDKFSNEIEEIDLSYNRITKIEGIDHLENLKKLSLKNNYLSKIEGIESLKKLELLDLSGNVNINEIPNFLNDIDSLNLVKLTGCKIKKVSESVSKFFWMGQNFRYYTNYRSEDIKYYEKIHRSRACINDRLYKNFVKWLFKLRKIMKRCHFNYEDIKIYENKNAINAIQSGKPTRNFMKFLDDKKQLRITNFF